MTMLIAACLGFFLTHLGISSTPLRGVLVSRLGETAYAGVFSLLAFVTLGWMIYAYSSVPHTDFLWLPSAMGYKVTKVLMLLALVLLVLGTMKRNPTAIMMDSAINDELQGVLKITRHPVQWAILLYSLAHLVANGDQASIIFFCTLALVSFLGTFAMDARKRRNSDAEWQAFMSKTSNVPFAALLTGRTHLTRGDIQLLPLGIGVALYAVVYWLHDMVSGGASLF